MSLALDEPNENDDTFDQGDFTFVIEKPLMEQAKSVKIDISYMGFTVTSEVPFSSGESACGSCSTGSCS